MSRVCLRDLCDGSTLQRLSELLWRGGGDALSPQMAEGLRLAANRLSSPAAAERTAHTVPGCNGTAPATQGQVAGEKHLRPRQVWIESMPDPPPKQKVVKKKTSKSHKGYARARNSSSMALDAEEEWDEAALACAWQHQPPGSALPHRSTRKSWSNARSNGLKDAWHKF